MRYKSFYSFLLLFFIHLGAVFLHTAFAQNLPLGTWTAHLPLQNAASICQSKNYVYAGCENGVIGVNMDNHLIEKYTKVSGLSEVFVAQVGYDTATSTLVIGYTNSNIDLIQNGKIKNLPYLKDADITGNKNIYHIFCTNGIAYISTGLGILKLNLEKQEVAETAIFNDGVNTYKVNAIWANKDSIFAATSKGVLSGIISPMVNLLNFNNWTAYSGSIPSLEATAITQYQGRFIAAVGNTLYQWDGANWSVLFSDANWVTRNLNNSNGHLLIVQQKLNGSNAVVDTRIGKWNGTDFIFYGAANAIAYPLQIIEDKNNTIWYADLYRGLAYQDGANFNTIYPNGPPRITNKEMQFLNKTLWVTSSDITDGGAPAFNKNGIYFCTDYTWDNLNIYNTPTLDSFFDISVVQPIVQDNKLIFGSQTGILEYTLADKSFKINKFRPGAVDPSKKIFRIMGADIDIQGNVWLADEYSNTPIVCRKQDGSYVYFNTGFLNDKLVKAILVDDFNQIWVAKQDNSGGLTMLNYGNDIDNKSDDRYYNFSTSSGNLPANNVICMAKDKDGEIWLGTQQGIATIPCPGYVTDNSCQAEQICIDRNDGSGFCDNLLEDEIINCILVDNANRKWIGTNNGLFLVSPDGKKTIHYFNESNSPLLSNYIRSLAINPENGDLFIGTGKGICSYRADATATTSDSPAPFVYPNPVKADYTGSIAFRGIPDNCNVKIIDVSGNLVYETTALGGQAVWDGNLVNGERAATGVYFALCKGNGKKETAKLKFVLMH